MGFIAYWNFEINLSIYLSIYISLSKRYLRLKGIHSDVLRSQPLYYFYYMVLNSDLLALYLFSKISIDKNKNKTAEKNHKLWNSAEENQHFLKVFYLVYMSSNIPAEKWHLSTIKTKASALNLLR